MTTVVLPNSYEEQRSITYRLCRLARIQRSEAFHHCRRHSYYLESAQEILSREACQTPWLDWRGSGALIRELRRNPLPSRYSSSQATLFWRVYARSISYCNSLNYHARHRPILEPYLNRPLGHADILRDAFPDGGRRRGVSDELVLKSEELLLCRSLPFLIFLLLGERTFAWWSARSRSNGDPGSPSDCRDGGRGCGR